jgi:hypothetical protein
LALLSGQVLVLVSGLPRRSQFFYLALPTRRVPSEDRDDHWNEIETCQREGGRGSNDMPLRGLAA